MKTTQRTMRIEVAPVGAMPGYLSITDRGETTQYRLCRCRGAFGQGWDWVKLSGPDMFRGYHTAVGDGQASCTCPHGTRRHQLPLACRHVAAIRELMARGRV